MNKNDTEEDGERLFRPSRSITCETWVIDEAMTGPGMMPAIPSDRKCQELVQIYVDKWLCQWRFINE